jgi:NAD-dependent SIR2 family protein deacetylase
MISWPKNLIEEIAYRRVILVLGSGISATAKNDSKESPKTWENFIEEAKSLMRDDTSTDFVNKMLEQKNYLITLQAIYSSCDPGEYADFLKREFLRSNFNPSEEHLAIKELDVKILITTNFDKIYDKICSGDEYVICDYKNTKKIISSIKSPENVIIKAHGSIDNVNDIIFTSEQYYNAKRGYPEFYKLLESLFSTYTVVFLGYSLSDPDINLILENIATSSSPTNPHYVVVKEGIPKQIKDHWQKTYNIVALEYGVDLNDLGENIFELKEQVLTLRGERKIP